MFDFLNSKQFNEYENILETKDSKDSSKSEEFNDFLIEELKH